MNGYVLLIWVFVIVIVGIMEWYYDKKAEEKEGLETQRKEG